MECPTSFSSLDFLVERESTGLGLAKSFVDLELDPHSCHISRSDAKYTNHFILRILEYGSQGSEAVLTYNYQMLEYGPPEASGNQARYLRRLEK